MNQVKIVKDERKILNVDPKPSDPLDATTWSSEQIRLAGSWAKHDLQHEFDPMCQPYDWKPGWTGDLTAKQVYQRVRAVYDSQS